MQALDSSTPATDPRSLRFPIARFGHDDAGHHFFGYYNKSPWHADGSRVLANRVDVMQGELGPHFAAQVGYFDLRGDGSFRAVGETTTWNFQMGCQLQWLDGRTDRSWYFAAATNGASIVLHEQFGFRELTRDFVVPGVAFGKGGGVLCLRELIRH